MSTRNITIEANGIEKFPIFTEPDENGFFRIRKDFYDSDFVACDVRSSENAIGMTIHALSDYDDLIEALLEHYPQTVFHLHSYCDGCSYDYDFGIKDDEYCEWNYTEASIYYDLYCYECDEEDCECAKI